MYQPSARYQAAINASVPSPVLQKKTDAFSQASADTHFALGQHYNKDTQQLTLAESDINELSSDSTPQSGNHTASESTPRTSVELQSVDLEVLQGKMSLHEEDDVPFDDTRSELLDYDDFPSPPLAPVPQGERRSSSRHSDDASVSPSSSPPGVGIVHGGSHSRQQAPIVPERGDSRPSPSQPANMSNEGSQFGMHNGASAEDVFRSSSHVLEDDYDYNSTDEEEQVLANGHDHDQQLAVATSAASIRRRSTDRAPPRGVAESHLPPTPPHSTQDSVLNTRKSSTTRASTTSSPSTASPLRQRPGEDKTKYFPAAALSSDIYKSTEKRHEPSSRSATIIVDRKRAANDSKSEMTSNKVEVDMQWSMQKLLNEDVFMKVVNDPQGRHQFRNFLEKEGTERLLDFYCDMTDFETQYEGRRQITEAVYESYVSEDADVRLDLPNDMSEDLYSTLRQTLEVKAAFSPMREHVRQGLYKDQFQRFIKSMLIDQYREKLGNLDSDDSYSGLSDCFCLTNPRAGTENPIVLASEGFLAVSGYTRQEVLGRNCRFLQGPATSPEAVDRIRDALNGGKGSMELLLNYQKDGTPFFCLLSIIPLRDARGQLAYFIGGQCNVSETLASGRTLEYLMGKNAEHAAKVHTHAASGTELSPTLARYFASSHHKTGNSLVADNRSISSKGTRDSDWNRGGKPARKAAGAYDPSKLRGPCGAPLLAGALADGSAAGSNGLLARITGRNSGKSAQDLPDLRPKHMPVSSSAPAPRQLTGQRLLGAEDLLRQAPASTLKDQLWLFTNLYSRIIIFKRHKREVIFVTAPLLEALGLPCASDADRYDSGLLHCDVLSLLQGTTKNETRVLRQAVQDAIHSGKPISVMTGLRRRPAKTGVSKLLADPALESASDRVIKYTALHVTPLYDRDDATFAFVAVLG